MRRGLILAGTIAVTALVAVVAWDVVKFHRHVPESAVTSNRANLIVIEKEKRHLALLRNGVTIKAYDLSLGGNPIKQQEGDGRSPEGSYKIDFKNQRSRFHLSLRISYPDAADREQAGRRGVPPGGDIMIHGLPNGLGWLQRLHLWRDWTDGCIAVTNAEIEEIWTLVDLGTTVDIRP